MIDRTSRWPEATPLTGISAEQCADAFVESWITRLGVPDIVTTDRGTQFSSSTWACLARTLGFKHQMTTAYHPQANGMVERLHRQIKEALPARACGTAWADHLPCVMLGIRATPKEDSGVTAARMVYGAELVLPGQPAAAVAKCEASWPANSGGGKDEQGRGPSIPLRARSYAEAAKGPIGELSRADFVYIRRGGGGSPMQSLYEGPFRVLERGNKTFKLQVGPRIEVVSVDRLKPHVGEEPVAVGQPPRRGRPPGTGGQSDSPGSSSRGG
jgi:Integrase core domain